MEKEKQPQRQTGFAKDFGIGCLLDIVLLAGFAWSVSLVVAGLNNPFAYANF